jgi:catechol 2,3-dioxygenase-like lactoylglutathione lyase family enzyme
MGALEWRFEHVHVYASDPDATVAWLTGLGGAVAAVYNHPGYPTAYDIEIGGQTLQVRGQRGNERFDPAGTARRFGIDHICLVADDMDAALEQLAANGITPETTFENGFSIPPGIAFLRGPDNLWVEIAPAALYDQAKPKTTARS